MSSNSSYGSNMLFQTITEDLNSSLAMADELSREFNSLMKEMSSSSDSTSAPASQSGLPTSTSTSSSSSSSSSVGVSRVGFSSSSSKDGGGGSVINRSTMSAPQISTSTIGTTSTPQPSTRSADSVFTSARNPPASPSSQYGLPPSHKHWQESGYLHGQLTPPNQSPHTQRRASPRPHERNLSGSFNYAELVSSPGHKYDQQSAGSMLQAPTGPMSPHDSGSMGRRSPRMDRVPSPNPLSQPAASTLNRNFMPFKPADEGLQRQKSPSKWNETDLDVSYERKPHHTYDKKEWIRPAVPSSNWRESNLDSPTTPRKELMPRQFQAVSGSLPRTARISVPPDHVPPTQSPYQPQPIISRISIPPSTPRRTLHRPIPLSVIMRLQNPHYTVATRYPQALDAQMNQPMYRQPIPLPREFLYQLQQPPQQTQPAYYGEVLNPGDVDAEVERLNTVRPPMVQTDLAPIPEQSGPVPASEPAKESGVEDPEPPPAPRPLSPTRLQPVVAPEAPVVPNMEELLLLRAEIPRALKKRGSVDQSQSLKKMPIIQPNQYKQMINRLFRRKGPHLKGETGSESSSSDSEEGTPAQRLPPMLPNMPSSAQERGLHSILRKSSKGNKIQSPRARLSPLVLLLDGALVGELETVQRAVQEMSDPSQPNDEGITALHNAICGGHYAVVEFLVQIGANVSAPDSHGWTPLHCAASCNDRALCEYLVRHGAAVMAVTESDGATAAQKCDPYAVGYEECESFLRGVEEMMGVENSGVLYALWSYPAQAADELSFKEGDMVTILQKPEGVDWWWASLCGREGFVPNNYFGLFPKVRPKSLC